jgi:TolA-binding protein
MMRRAAIVAASLGLFACAATTTSEKGTLAELENRQADLEEVLVADSLDRAAQSYRRYLEETPESARTPEAMRRLADLQIEQAYGVMGSGDIVEMVAPEAATKARQISTRDAGEAAAGDGESEAAFEQRATEREQLLARPADFDAALPDGGELDLPAGPKEAIATYWSILEQYPNYERNDQVLYQLSRAYDEIGEPDQAMEVMDRLVAEYPFSKYLDEIHFRRGEYFFVRRQFLDGRASAQVPLTTSWRCTSWAGHFTSRSCTRKRCTTTSPCSIIA